MTALPTQQSIATRTLAIPVPSVAIVQPGLWRLTASIAGAEIFLEAPVPLSPRPEVLVCPFLLPAMSHAMDLHVAAPLSPGFLSNLQFVRQRAIEWWPQLSAGHVQAPIGEPANRAPHSATFYTGGADSSYVLQQLHSRLRYAIFVEGFDVSLKDSKRLIGTRNWLSAAAEACGVQLLNVRTNLKQHPFFASLSWEITHISALAAIAHALGHHVHTMYVAASDVPPPWGSAPELDAAWSSESVKIENFSPELTRLQRVASIAHWPPVRGRLRVCWENNTDDLNCGFCEKCLRTRLELYISGALDGLDSFPIHQPLRATLGRLSAVPHELHGQWREIADRLTDPALLREVQRILQGRRHPLWWRGLRRLKRIARRALRL